jgi:hypothetical protein
MESTESISNGRKKKLKSGQTGASGDESRSQTPDEAKNGQQRQRKHTKVVAQAPQIPASAAARAMNNALVSL